MSAISVMICYKGWWLVGLCYIGCQLFHKVSPSPIFHLFFSQKQATTATILRRRFAWWLGVHVRPLRAAAIAINLGGRNRQKVTFRLTLWMNFRHCLTWVKAKVQGGYISVIFWLKIREGLNYGVSNFLLLNWGILYIIDCFLLRD